MKKAATLLVDPEYTKLSVQLPVCDIYDCEFKIKSMTFECGHNEYLSFQMKIYTSTLSGYTSINVKRNTIDLYCGSKEGKVAAAASEKPVCQNASVLVFHHKPNLVLLFTVGAATAWPVPLYSDQRYCLLKQLSNTASKFFFSVMRNN